MAMSDKSDKKMQSGYLTDDDRFFIMSLMSLPLEKKALIQGILIGMNLQNGNKDTASQS